MLAVHGDRVVRGRAAKIVPPLGLLVVDVGARVDQHRLAAQVKRKAQAVGVPVRGDREVAERAVIEEKELLALALAAAHDRVAASRELLGPWLPALVRRRLAVGDRWRAIGVAGEPAAHDAVVRAGGRELLEPLPSAEAEQPGGLL